MSNRLRCRSVSMVRLFAKFNTDRVIRYLKGEMQGSIDCSMRMDYTIQGSAALMVSEQKITQKNRQFDGSNFNICAYISDHPALLPHVSWIWSAKASLMKIKLIVTDRRRKQIMQATYCYRQRNSLFCYKTCRLRFPHIRLQKTVIGLSSRSSVPLIQNFWVRRDMQVMCFKNRQIGKTNLVGSGVFILGHFNFFDGNLPLPKV